MSNSQGEIPSDEFRNTIYQRLQDYNPSVGLIDLSLCRIDPSWIDWMIDGLKSLKGLRELNLSSNDICEAGALVIAKHLQDLSNLTTLNIGVNYIGDVGTATITQHLRHLPHLTTLNLERNNIGKIGATVIAEHLQYLPNLTCPHE